MALFGGRGGGTPGQGRGNRSEMFSEKRKNGEAAETGKKTLDASGFFVEICVSPLDVGHPCAAGKGGCTVHPAMSVVRPTLTFAGVTDCRKDVKSR